MILKNLKITELNLMWQFFVKVKWFNFGILSDNLINSPFPV